MINLIHCGVVCVQKCKEKHFYRNQNEQGGVTVIFFWSSWDLWLQNGRNPEPYEDLKVFHSCYLSLHGMLSDAGAISS